ncbi:folylpolyglutamate synthase/dihydrofolate synthase family protein [Mycobacterium sp. AZCC_0083]|uniref:bifunctional folylpolyglutamate synthase/dihydrofolate synthase n=1 Tax=Mycobacterium sp. AZCC_0083 TaxID=2735882 RepID=UPI00161DDBBD|nr:Mur ligase family protein [Mycobacterium sp. AZCC_0083]MBB5167642.1 dihydrofolate synthase/folylpolyglutamate synthase [Mycobacterium sp. AZCC_0083]
MTITTIEEASSTLAAYIPQTPMKENYALDRMQSVVQCLGNPQEAYPSIHVAGTSGKTSVAYFVTGLLQEAGFRTGLTISPFVESITERVQIGGPVPEQMFVDYLNDFLPRVRASGLQPSYFEMLVAFAFDVFRAENVDYAVIETGLGGLLDGTNVISRPDKIAVITDIGLDHTEILGETVEDIAAQKAGIVQPGNMVIIQGGQDPAVLSVLRSTAQARRASQIVVTSDPHTGTRSRDDVPLFQHRNWSLAQAVVNHVAARDGLPQIDRDRPPPIAFMPPGRMEVLVLNEQYVILDGAHNPQKLSALAESLAGLGVKQIPVLAALGRSTEAKVSSCLDVIATFASTLVITDFSAKQDLGRLSWPADELIDIARQRDIENVSAQSDSHRALQWLLNRGESSLLITGSLYLVAELRGALLARGALKSTLGATRSAP